MNSASQPSRKSRTIFESWRLWLVPSATCAAILYALVFLVPYAAGYHQTRRTLAQTLEGLWANEQWQHCWLVLPALAAVIYFDRARFSKIRLRGSLAGLMPLLLGLAFYWVGYRVENYYLGFAALHLLVIGMVLFLVGWRWLWALSFPLLFLVFLWPLYFLENSLTFPLRMIMSHASVAVLNLLGIPVILQGTGIISAPDPLVGLAAGKKFSVDVADPCSGIRSLFALMMVSALYAHFTLKTWWKKWILFLCSIPLAIAGNLARILTLTIGTVAFGAEFAIGKNALTEPSWFHLGAGYMVFAVALGGMIAIAWLLNGGAADFAGWMRAFAIQNERQPRASESRDPATPKHKRQDLY